MKIYLNGKFVDKKDACISVFDHGFLYGDGAFEGIRAYNGLVFKLAEHMDRLYQTIEALRIDVSLSKDEMMQAIVDTLKENNLNDAYIRVIVTRGEGDLGLDPRKCAGNAGVIIITDKITLYPKELYEKGMEIMTASTIRNHPQALDPKLKSLNYLNNILAKIEANDQNYLEAIMLDHNGNVAECTGDNIFIIKDNVLYTPSDNILMGITRNAVLSLAKESKIETVEGPLKPSDVSAADECFLTGTAAEIIPIVKIDGQQVGDGTPGEVTKKMIEMFHEATKLEGVKY